MRVLGVLDGRDLPPATLRAWADSADKIVAADGAGDWLLANGVTPDIVVGDMDSFRGSAAAIEVFRDEDQKSTDCDKLLKAVGSLGLLEQLTLIGVEGDLPDHVQASLSSCARISSNVRIGFRRGLGHIFTGPLTVAVKIGTRVSLLPLTPCSGVSLAGVRWPFEHAEMHVGGFISISNRATENEVAASISTGKGLLFHEVDPGDLPLW